MKLGRVVGTVVSTIKAPVFEGRRLLLCDLLEPDGSAAGGYVIAVDAVGSGASEIVLILDEGNSSRQILGLETAPVRTMVVGIVDEVTLAPSPERSSVSPGSSEPPNPTATPRRSPRSRPTSGGHSDRVRDGDSRAP